VIFATVGTHHQPFDRLVRALAGLGRDDLVIQYGHSAPPAFSGRAAAFMSFAEIEGHMREAAAVVTHAGVGSILLARRCGHIPIVVARQSRQGEHVDDHQVELTTALAPRGEIVAVDDLSALGDVLADPPARRPLAVGAAAELHAAVRAALWGEPVTAGSLG
jgi:UDP-N-acetylglucosamine transferase subunit ALG13